MNIVNLAMRFLGPMVANKAASMLGLNNSVATKLISAALPTIMASLLGKSSTGAGASALWNLLKSDQVGDPSGLEGILDGPDAANHATAGGNILSDLLGGNAMNGLAGALGKYGGAGAAETSSLLGLVGPVALGSLKQQVTEQDLDADGLATFLSGQKANIAGAIPNDFAPELQSAGLLDGIDLPNIGGIGEKVTEMAETAATYTPDMSADVPKSGGMMKWIIGALVLLGLGWYFLGGSDTPEMASDLPAGIDMNVGDVNVGEQFTGVVDGLKTTIGGITDGDSAQAAIPQLEDANTRLGELAGLADQLPEAAQGPFQSMVGTAVSALKPMIDSAIEASGAGAILQPIADSMLEKLTGMAG